MSAERVVRALTRAFGDGWTVRSQGPVALDATSEPEPDVAVVRGDLLDYASAHPSDPVLVVEVTLKSATLDRRYKSSLYARAAHGILVAGSRPPHTRSAARSRAVGARAVRVGL
jgi:Uma2 family endonuclease